MADKADRLMQWLRDAHAMEIQAETMLTRQAQRLEHYPALRSKLEQHAEETRHHADLVRSCIERRGGDTSTVKDVGAQALATLQVVGGMFAGDEIVKGAMADYTFEHFEIAAYRALSAAAADLGDSETQRACDEILREEEDMASWLSSYLPEVTQLYLHREAEGIPAKD